MAASSTRWLSNWIVTPILRLGYRPLTFRWPPPTRRAGPEERIRSITDRASGERFRPAYQVESASGSSIESLLFPRRPLPRALVFGSLLLLERHHIPDPSLVD